MAKVTLPKVPFKVGPATLQWIFINGDGSLNDMGDEPRYEYKATAVLPGDKAQPFIDTLKQLWKDYEGKAKPKSLGYREEVDEEGNTTGNITFTFKTNVSYTDRKGHEHATVVRVFRANGQEITDDFHDNNMKAANGSEGVIHGVAAVYDRNAAARGITLYLSAVQFTKFIEYTGNVNVEALATEADDGLDLSQDNNLDITPENVPDI